MHFTTCRAYKTGCPLSFIVKFTFEKPHSLSFLSPFSVHHPIMPIMWSKYLTMTNIYQVGRLTSRRASNDIIASSQSCVVVKYSLQRSTHGVSRATHLYSYTVQNRYAGNDVIGYTRNNLCLNSASRHYSCLQYCFHQLTEWCLKLAY